MGGPDHTISPTAAASIHKKPFSFVALYARLIPGEVTLTCILVPSELNGHLHTFLLIFGLQA